MPILYGKHKRCGGTTGARLHWLAQDGHNQRNSHFLLNGYYRGGDHIIGPFSRCRSRSSFNELRKHLSFPAALLNMSDKPSSRPGKGNSGRGGRGLSPPPSRSGRAPVEGRGGKGKGKGRGRGAEDSARSQSSTPAYAATVRNALVPTD